MPDSIRDLIALVLGLVALWFLGCVFSHEARPDDHGSSPRKVKGGS